MMRKTRSKHIEKYGIFLKWKDADDVPAKELAAQWGISPQAVYSMIGVAKRNPKIFEYLVEKLKYSPEEIPEWVKRPDVVADTQSFKGGLSSTDGGESLGRDEASSGYAEGEVHVAPKPQQYRHSPFKNETQEIGEDNLNQPNSASPNLSHLAEVVPRPDSTEVEGDLPSSQEDTFLERVVENVTMKELTVRTQTIMKKIALNPKVFLCYTYLAHAKDPHTGKKFFEGDLADFLNYCVRFTMEKGFGVVPSMVTGLPSLLQIMREQKRRSFEDPVHIPLWGQVPESKE